ncbi:MAG: hypothetical protein SVX38_16680 [Chloroflexota bacterium]|nr:hypothetical protein [Chloroflexota bacterium]
MGTDRDPFLALMLEVIGGLFGFLGVGWIYAGHAGWGLVLLVVYWLLDWAIGLTLTVFTLGVWCFFWPAQNLILGCVSGYFAYRSLQRRALW